MSVIITNHDNGWKTIQSGDHIWVEVRPTGLLMLPEWLTRAWSPEYLPELIEVLSAAHALSLGNQDCGECGEQVAWFTSGPDGNDRWYHTATSRTYCYRNPEHKVTAYPHPNRQPATTERH